MESHWPEDADGSARVGTAVPSTLGVAPTEAGVRRKDCCSGVCSTMGREMRGGPSRSCVHGPLTKF